MSFLVSVIIPTYNRRHTLDASIESVLVQTYANFEILLIDDGSTDDTSTLVQGLRDERIRYVRLEHSGLPSVARNAGIRRARGKYLAFLDSDDLWVEDKLHKQVCYMESNPELALTYTNLYSFESDPNDCKKSPMLKPEKTLSGYVFYKLYAHQLIPNSTVMVQTNVVSKIGLLREDRALKANEDYEYWLRIAYQYPIGYIDLPLTKYRQHSGGISKAQVEHFQSKLYLIDLIDKQFPSVKTELASERQSWLSEVYYGLGRSLLRLDRVAEAKPCFKRAWKHKPIALAWWIAANMGRSCYQFFDGFKSKIGFQSHSKKTSV